MKKLMACAVGAVLVAMPALAYAKDVTVGMSWNQKEVFAGDRVGGLFQV